MKRLSLLVLIFFPLASFAQTIAGSPVDTTLFRKLRTQIKDAEYWIKMSPDNPEHYFKRGEVYILLQDHEAALKDFDKCVALTKGKNAPSLYKRASVYDRLERYDEALTDFTAVIQMMPDWEWAYNDRAMIYTALKDFDNAEKDFTIALQLKPNWHVAYTNMAVMYDKKGAVEKAVEYYERALKGDAGNSMAYNNLGAIYDKKKMYPKAIEYYDWAIQHYPMYFNAYRNRADAKRANGDTAGACADIKKAALLGDEKSIRILATTNLCD